jgi:hypothetical protein
VSSPMAQAPEVKETDLYRVDAPKLPDVRPSS